MYEEIKKLRHSLWLTTDEKIQLIFQDNKGLSMVKVRERGDNRSEHMYLLLPTLESEVFAFDTPNGRFTVGISSTGEEVFLYPYGQIGCKPQTISINNAESQMVNNSATDIIN